MQSRQLITDIREKDIAEVFTRNRFPQVCNTFKLYPASWETNFLSTVDLLLSSFEKETFSKVKSDVEILSEFDEEGKLKLVFSILKKKNLSGKIIGWARIDERKTSNNLYTFYTTVETNFALFVVQKIKQDFYLHIFAKQARSESFVKHLRDYLAPSGISISKAVLSEEKILELKKTLGLTTIEEVIDNVWPGINLKATGDGLDKESEYLKVVKDGKKKSFVFRSPLPLDKKKHRADLFRISVKGLTHFRNSITPKFHLDFITQHLIDLFSYETSIITVAKIKKPNKKLLKKIKA